jgi:hypothetical protein
MQKRITILALGLFAAAAQAQAPLEGRWEGQITREGKEWPVRADVVREGIGTQAYLDFPGYGLFYRRGTVDRPDGAIRIT